MNYDRCDVRKRFILLIVAGFLPLGGCFKGGQQVLQPPISISIPNLNLSLFAGQAGLIKAVVYDQSGQGVTWSATPNNFGTLTKPTFDSKTLTATVTYTAPANVPAPTNVTVTATSITNPNITSSVTLNCSPISVSIVLPIAARTVGPGQNFFTQATTNDPAGLGVTWSLSPSTGAGTLTGALPNPQLYGRYTAPSSVSAPITALITATSVSDPTSSATVQVTVLPSGGGPNVAVLNVNGGPVPGQVYPNRAYTSVTLCNPGSIATCQTVDGVMVDTGSYGLRILQSQIPLLKLPAYVDPLGNTLHNCAAWPDGSVLWGPVETADLYISAEIAQSLPVQVIPGTPSTVPDGCSSTGVSNSNTPQLLGANGILGIGPEPNDCTVSGINYCDGSQKSPLPNVYYSCPSGGCAATDSPVVVSASLQVSNPVPLFSSGFGDSNGVAIQFPAVSDPQASVVGTLTFGIGTQSNNQLGSATVYTLDAHDNFTTLFSGQTLSDSFIDSGSSALFFPDALPACTTNTQFYCPSSPVVLSATNMGKTTGQSTIDFTVEDADSFLFAFPQDSVFPNFAGPSQNQGSCSQGGASCVFDWGLPFFYGRTTFMAIDGLSTPPGSPAPPWWAY